MRRISILVLIFASFLASCVSASDPILLAPIGWEESNDVSASLSLFNFTWDEIQQKSIISEDETRIVVVKDGLDFLLTFPDQTIASSWLAEITGRRGFIYILVDTSAVEYVIDDWNIEFIVSSGEVFAPYDGSIFSMGFMETFRVFSARWNGLEVGMTGFDEDSIQKNRYTQGEVLGPLGENIQLSFLNIDNPHIGDELIPVLVEILN